jgi:hypothetical protein
MPSQTRIQLVIRHDLGAVCKHLHYTRETFIATLRAVVAANLT